MILTFGDNRKMEEYSDGVIGYSSPSLDFQTQLTNAINKRWKTMMGGYEINNITKILDDVITNDINRSMWNWTGIPARTAPRTNSDDEIIMEAIKNGMISANVVYLGDGTKRFQIDTPTEKLIFDLDKNAKSRIEMAMTSVSDAEYRRDNMSTTSKTREIDKMENQTGIAVIDNQVAEKPVVKKPKKFKLGEHYIIYPMKNKRLRREYVVKKTVYTILDKEVNIVIMKQLSGPQSNKFTLSKEDCLKLHLKWEEGLEVFSMELDWKLIKTNK
jgi:hypothetical protein